MGGPEAPRGFFFGRRPLEIEFEDTSALLPYPNVPATIGAAISSGKATAAELSTVLSLEDVYDLLEVAAIDAHNFRLLHPRD